MIYDIIKAVLSAVFGSFWSRLFGTKDPEKEGLQDALKQKQTEAAVMEAAARPESRVDDELRRHAVPVEDGNT